MKENRGGEYTEGFLNHLKETKKFIEESALEDLKEETFETEDAIINRMKLDINKTSTSKERFINEIKSGLGEQITNNKVPFTVIKKPWYVRFNDKFKKIINKI